MKTTKRTRRNDTPKMPRPAKTAAVYIRIDADVMRRIRQVAIERGRPHTFASVAGEALKIAFSEPVEPVKVPE